MKKPTITYFYRGRVERIHPRRRGNPWWNGYSTQGEGGGVIYPWMTFRECQADAKAKGCRAVFVKEPDQ